MGQVVELGVCRGWGGTLPGWRGRRVYEPRKGTHAGLTSSRRTTRVKVRTPKLRESTRFTHSQAQVREEAASRVTAQKKERVTKKGMETSMR